jgi:hypothetical protein
VTDYHNFKGAALRIKVYWTSGCLQQKDSWNNSLILIRRTGELLRKYTLSLDVSPPGAPDTVHTAARKNLANSVVGPAITRIGQLIPASARSVAGDIAGKIVNQVIDVAWAKEQGLIQYSGSINLPYQGSPSIAELQTLRKLIEPVTEENRLVVVFVPTEGVGGGWTSRYAQWLPWVILDPKHLFSDSLLLHEIGHACRLAHQQAGMMAESSGNEDELFDWQVDTIFDSYWCAGPKPKDWWENKIRPQYNRYLWDQ